MVSAVADRPLHALAKGEGGVPLCLLHGFGASVDYWHGLHERLARERRVIGYDLPGHGQSADIAWGRGTGAAADMLAADLLRRGHARVHACGHSLGGAVASVFALKFPRRVASLTLLAPGGFGPQIDARLIRRYAAASSAEELVPLLKRFYGTATPVTDAQVRRVWSGRPAGGGQLPQIAESFLVGDEQGQLPVTQIAALRVPVTVIWGAQDRVTPAHQAHGLPGVMAVHVFDRVGHSIADEIPDAVFRLLTATMAR